MTRRGLLLAVVAVLLAACGRKGPVSPPRDETEENGDG